MNLLDSLYIKDRLNEEFCPEDNLQSHKKKKFILI